MANQNSMVKVAYDLQNKGAQLNKKIAYELKSMLDNKKITKTEFKDTLKELDKL